MENTAVKLEALPAFCRRLGIVATSEWVDTNPNMSDMMAGSNHYKVTLTRKAPRRSLTVFFSMGPAHCKEPTAVEVLSCLLSDSDVENYDFEEWASNLGYDADSRKAERTYRVCVKQTERLRRFLGDDFDAALACEPY